MLSNEAVPKKPHPAAQGTGEFVFSIFIYNKKKKKREKERVFYFCSSSFLKKNMYSVLKNLNPSFLSLLKVINHTILDTEKESVCGLSYDRLISHVG